MFDSSPSKEAPTTLDEEPVVLDKDATWIISTYLHLCKKSEDAERPSLEEARTEVITEIQSRCRRLHNLYVSTKQPLKSHQERVHLVIAALDTPPYNGGYRI